MGTKKASLSYRAGGNKCCNTFGSLRNCHKCPQLPKRGLNGTKILTIEHCEDGGEDIAVVQLSEDDQGLAAGQFAAFYQGRRCLGSGVILEAWDDQGFPVCKKALEIARMEDKSKLGKPVKIKVKPETPMEFDNNKGIESSRNLFNGQNGVVENRNTTSQVQEEAIPRFPWNWMHKLSEKWTHCVAGIKFAFDEMPISDV